MARRVAEDGVLIADILLGVLAVLVIMGHYFIYSTLQRDLDLDIQGVAKRLVNFESLELTYF